MMIEVLIDELTGVRNTTTVEIQRVRSIRASLRCYVYKLAKLQGFYTGLGAFSFHHTIKNVSVDNILTLRQFSGPYLEYIEKELLAPSGATHSQTSRRPDARVSPFVLDNPTPYNSSSY